MNWPAAKTYLILAFVVLNAFLGYRLWAEQGTLANAGLDVAAVQAAVERENISLEARIPRRAPSLGTITVSPFVEETEAFAEERFFPVGDGDMELEAFERGDDRMLYRFADERLDRFGDGLLLFRRPPPTQDEYVIDHARAITTAEEFLSARSLWHEDGYFADALMHDLVMRHRPDPDAPDLFFVRLHQHVNGTPVFDGGITLRVDASREVTGFRARQLVVEGDDEAPRQVVSAAAALERLLAAADQGRLELAGVTRQESLAITDIRLGYAIFREQETGVPMLESPEFMLADAAAGHVWEATPSWRVALSDRRFVYLDAYSGDLLHIEKLGSGF